MIGAFADSIAMTMQTTHLGRTGLVVSRLCLGMMTYGTPQWRPWVLDAGAARPIFKLAVERGINFFDTADMYSAGASEEITGSLVREFCRRDEVVVATKLFHPVSMEFASGIAPKANGHRPAPNTSGLSRKRIFHAIDASLSRLGLDYVDLYQIHRWDNATPIEETMQALHDVVKAGKVRYLGASSMWAWQFAKMQYTADLHGWTRFISMQDQYNLVAREEEREMYPLLADQGVGAIPWSPLAAGLVTRPWGEASSIRSGVNAKTDRSGTPLWQDSDQGTVDAVQRIAEDRGIAMAQVALAWVLHNPVVSAPIVGSTKPHHLSDAVAALDVKLTDDEITALEAHYTPRTPTYYGGPSAYGA